MKKSLFILFILSSLASFSQRNEFQIRIGAGYGSYSANTKWTYSGLGNKFSDEENECFTKVLPHAELKYYFAKAHLTVGFHFSAGLRATTSATESSYDIARIGLALEYNIIDKPDFRLYVGIQPTYRALAIYNGVYIGEDPAYDLSTIWSGLGISASAGVNYFFKQSWLGIHANVGWDGFVDIPGSPSAIWDPNVNSQKEAEKKYGPGATYLAPGTEYRAINGKDVLILDGENWIYTSEVNDKKGNKNEGNNNSKETRDHIPPKDDDGSTLPSNLDRGLKNSVWVQDLPITAFQSEQASQSEDQNRKFNEYNQAAYAYFEEMSQSFENSVWTTVNVGSTIMSLGASGFATGGLRSMAVNYGDDVARASVNNGSRAFFSGAGAEARAIEKGFQTLGQTSAGQNLANLTKGMPYHQGSEAFNMWARLSATYAKGVPNGSTVNVFLNNASKNGIWNTVERPILEGKGVSFIFR